ncbi:UDP-glucuronosyltransferase 3A1-like [Gastrophryne carolinensis]
MAAHGKHLLSCIFTLQFLLLHGAKILTVSFMGGSHFLLMDEVSRILQNNGHDVRMFRQFEDMFMSGYEEPSLPYKVTTSFIELDPTKGFASFLINYEEFFFSGSRSFQPFLYLMREHSKQCQVALNRTNVLQFLRQEKYDIAVVDALNPCTLLICEKLGIPYISLFSTSFILALRVGLHSPLSYVPMIETLFTDRMDFFERLQNTLAYLVANLVEKSVESIFDETIDKYFPADSRPSFFDLYKKAELTLINTDFTIEFPRPLLPNVQFIGGLMTKPANLVSQEVEEFIRESGEAGFIVVTFGSMYSAIPLINLVQEMNNGFSKIPQKVIWRYKRSQWPNNLQLAPNIKLMDWFSQNDLLGHAKIRLLVTHGGMNSLSEAIFHGVPVVGIPLFGDQLDNMVRMKAKNMGTYILPNEIKAESFANTLRNVIENQSYKTTAMKLRTIRQSQPFPPDQQLVRWVEHIIQSGGGSHLRPYSYQQPWYQQYLLDVILFLVVCLAVIIYLTVTSFRVLIWALFSSRKQKQN